MSREQQLNPPSQVSAFQVLEIADAPITLRFHQAVIAKLNARLRHGTDRDSQDSCIGLLLGRSGEGAVTVYLFEGVARDSDLRAALESWRCEPGHRMWAVGLVSISRHNDNRGRQDLLQRAHALLAADPAIALEIGMASGQPMATVWLIDRGRPSGQEFSTELSLEIGSTGGAEVPSSPEPQRVVVPDNSDVQAAREPQTTPIDLEFQHSGTRLVLEARTLRELVGEVSTPSSNLWVLLGSYQEPRAGNETFFVSDSEAVSMDDNGFLTEVSESRLREWSP